MVNDPVCGMEVNDKTTKYKSIHASNLYYFCSTSCKTEFNGTTGCGAPAKGLAWYFYVGLLILLLLVLLLSAL